MNILAALFIDAIDLRSVEGPSTRIDLTGIQFSAAAPSAPPFTIEPHLCVIVHCPVESRSDAALEVVFRRGDDVLARNVQPLQVEPGIDADRDGLLHGALHFRLVLRAERGRTDESLDQIRGNRLGHWRAIGVGLDDVANSIEKLSREVVELRIG